MLERTPRRFWRRITVAGKSTLVLGLVKHEPTQLWSLRRIETLGIGWPNSKFSVTHLARSIVGMPDTSMSRPLPLYVGFDLPTAYAFFSTTSQVPGSETHYWGKTVQTYPEQVRVCYEIDKLLIEHPLDSVMHYRSPAGRLSQT